MRKSTIGLASILVPAMAGVLAASGCSEDGSDPFSGAAEDLCGPCGAVVTGDVGISGNAKLDGFFQAVSTLNTSVLSINADFEANIDSLIATFGTEVAANANIQAKVDALVADIQAEVSANVEGGLVVNYVPPSCQANVSVAVEAQAKCEVKAGCEAEVDPGNISVQCEGKCEGSCEGTCSGGFRCDVSATGECSGSCEGTCELDAAAECNGTCRGTCSGTCSAYAQGANGMAECAGQCDGMCTGTCEFNVAAECNGSCRGSCVVEVEAECEGEAPSCSGSCEGSCSGGCTGEATPPSVAVDCEASADCQAQAKAQASASVECTPPSLDIGFDLTAQGEAAATFTAHIAELKVRGVAILQGFAQYEALINGEVNGEVVFETSPIDVVVGELEGVISASVSGDLFADIPIFRANCAFGALSESVDMLEDIGTSATANLSAQAEFAAVLTGG